MKSCHTYEKSQLRGRHLKIVSTVQRHITGEMSILTAAIIVPLEDR